MRDIQIKECENVFNYRVSGALIKDNKILLNRLKKDDFWTFVGGKVSFGESSEKAIVREYFEETGANIGVERLAAFVENFFNYESKQWHEILLFYVIYDENEELQLFEGEREIKDNDQGVYKWFELSDLDKINLQPECSYQIINNMEHQSFQHIINELHN
ncbi:MAG: NUDIX hydrolase [Ruminococcus sp.]